uniref:Pr1-like protein n=1 Tax=Oryza sativa subsp. japonica TaxID=39947 RepID=Q5Z7C5_ORYSJ|nr:pr1-like protein [Oryza sativa Japonica Group]BAD54189.1 pr1-like protein [Oryza sativa Japonica Group]
MWKYGSALQQRPELNPYSGRGATSHNWHAPKPHRKQVLGVLKGEERSEGGDARTGSTGVGPTRQPLGPRWTGRTRLTAAGAVGPTRQPHPRARAADSRAPHGSREGAPEGGLAGTADGRERARAPMVTAGDHRRGGAAPERAERRGKRKGRSTAHPGTTTTTRTAAGAEEGGGAARDDDDGGAPTVGERNEGADEVDGDAEGGGAEPGGRPKRRRRRTGAEEGDGAVRDAEGDGAPAVGGRSGAADGVGNHSAKPKEVAPSRAEDRSDVGGEPKVGGDGGERGARRGHETDGESERRAAETEERSTGIEYIATGGGERGRGERKPRAEISGAIEDAGELRGMNPDESEGEREGKEGETGEGITGSDSPLIKARGEGGMRRIQRRRRR